MYNTVAMSLFGNTSRKKQFEEFNKAYIFYKVSFLKFVSENIDQFTKKFHNDDKTIFAVRSTDYLLGEASDLEQMATTNTSVARAIEIQPLIRSETERMYRMEVVQSVLLPLLEWKFIRLGKLMGDEFIDSEEGKTVKSRIDDTPAYVRNTDDYKKTLREMTESYESIIK